MENIEPTFRVFFNSKKQWVDVYLHDVHPTTFANWNMGRWGCFNKDYDNPRAGYFGDVHMVESRVREDLVVHELDHVRWEWMWANRIMVSNRNEETLTALLDELVRNFYREWRKLNKKKKK